MDLHGNQRRMDRPNFDLLGRALVVSLAIHILCYGGYTAEKEFGLLCRIPLPAWLRRMQETLASTRAIPKNRPPAASEPPLIFVEANPAFAVPEPPKNAPYYSSHSSRAANPDADAETGTPMISGTQTYVPRTETTPRQPQPLQPAPPVQEPETKPRASQPPGDLAFAKPESKQRKTDGQEDTDLSKARPRTLAEAAARKSAHLMPGEAMKQAGGVRARNIQSTLDAASTPFGVYDAAVVAAIQNRWYQLIDDQPLTRATGKVMLAFHLNYDGTISELKVLETTVSQLLTAMCQRAILDPAPYGVWPSDMRRMVGANFRDVTFTFYYY